MPIAAKLALIMFRTPHGRVPVEARKAPVLSVHHRGAFRFAQCILRGAGAPGADGRDKLARFHYALLRQRPRIRLLVEGAWRLRASSISERSSGTYVNERRDAMLFKPGCRVACAAVRDALKDPRQALTEDGCSTTILEMAVSLKPEA